MISCLEITRRFPELWKCLENARLHGRLAHAFLVSSEREETREAFAVALARLAACRKAAETGIPCGECPECRRLAEGNYPDLQHLSPVGKMYQIQVGERNSPEPNTVRAFADSFSLTDASGAACKIGIIHDADRMNAEAQNALLKTLEEPPPQTLLILTTGNPAALLPTTRSRCQLLRLPESHVDYDFSGSKELFAALHDLFYTAGEDPVRAEGAAMRLIAVSTALKEDAATAADDGWDERLKQIAEYDAGMAKRLEKQRDSEAFGAYMRRRAAYLSAIRTFAGELYLLASGSAAENLPNPELPVLPPAGGTPDFPRAERMLRCAEELLFNLRFNVNEELALRDFALQTALGTSRQ